MESPVFVIGMARTGTSLLQRILDAHSHLSIFDESDIFLRAFDLDSHAPMELTPPSAIHALLDAIAPRLERNQLSRDEVEARFYQTSRDPMDLLDVMLKLRMEKRQKRRFGDKTPHNFFHVDRLRQRYPGAQFVFIHRDPRPSYASFRLYRRYGPALRPPHYRTLVRRAVQWSKYIRRMKRAMTELPRGQRMAISFAELLCDPHDTVKRICCFLGEPFEEQMLDVDGSNSSYTDVRPRGVDTMPLERGHGLTRRDLLAIEWLCGDQMLAVGYALELLPEPVVRFLRRRGYYRLQAASYDRYRALRRRLGFTPWQA